MSFWCGYIFFISETSYQLSSIFKLCSTKADICVQSDADVEHISNDAVAELLLCNLEAQHQKSTFSEKKLQCKNVFLMDTHVFYNILRIKKMKKAELNLY